MKKIYMYKDLLIELVKRDIKKKYRRSVLGVLWSMLNPFFIMIITTIVFSNIFRFAIENFPVYLLSGQLIFNFYSESTSIAMGTILENSSLIKKVYVPKYIFPLSKIISSGVNFLLALPGLFLVIFITGMKLDFSVLFAIFPIIYLAIFCFGIGLLLSSIAVFFRDIFHLYSVLLIAINYMTPIFYPIEIIPDKYRVFINFNPLFYFVNMFREIFFKQKIPSLELNFTCMTISLVTLLIGIFIFSKNERKFILYI